MMVKYFCLGNAGSHHPTRRYRESLLPSCLLPEALWVPGALQPPRQTSDAFVSSLRTVPGNSSTSPHAGGGRSLIEAGVTHGSRKVQTTPVPIDGRVDKQNVCPHAGVLFSLQKEGNGHLLQRGRTSARLAVNGTNTAVTAFRGRKEDVVSRAWGPGRVFPGDRASVLQDGQRSGDSRW